MNILHITSILPAPVSNKLDENDILLRLTQELKKTWPEDTHSFIFVVPYSNFFLSKFKKKWKDYYSLLKAARYSLNELTVHVIGIPGFQNDSAFRPFFASFAYSILYKKRIKEVVNQVKPDLIHAHNMIHNMELAECLRKDLSVPLAVTARNINEYALKRLQNKKVNADKILTLNRLNTNRCEKVPKIKERVFMIPHPVDEVFFQKETAFKKNHSILSLVSVGKLIKLKNLDKVITALASVDLDFTYTIIGEGSEKLNLLQLVSAKKLENRINFLGFLPHEEVNQEIRKHDIMILPSYPETLGRVYFEAMASGLPVIAAKKSGIDGMIEDSVQGFMVNHNSVEEIIDVIKKYAYLSIHEKQRMSENALKFASEFTWEATLEKYHKFYHT